MIDTPFSRFAEQYGLAYDDVLDCFNWLTDQDKRPAVWDTMTVPARELLIIMIGPAIDRRKLVELRTWLVSVGEAPKARAALPAHEVHR